MNKSKLKKITSARLFLPIVCLIAVLLLNVIRTPDFFNVSIRNGVLYGYIVDVINRASELVILAIGMTLVTAASGGQDISVGAIMAVVVLYWSKLWPFYIRKIPKKTQMALRKQPAVPRTVLTFVEKYCDKDKWILWFKILVACLPTIIIALPFNDIIEKKFYNYVVVAIMLIVYGVLFIVIENYNKRRRPTCTRLDELSFKTALIIGCFQVLSVIPGTSRSGSTIIGGILAGTSRTVAAEFTFFLAIPVMFGASLLKLVKFGFAFSSTELIILIVGVLVSFVVSILAIKFLMGYIKKHDFKAFGWYRIILGILVLGYFIGKTLLA